jgi:hypothetical protein
MAHVSFDDIIEPAPKFASYVMNATLEKSRLFQSGAVAPDPQISEMIAGSGGSLYKLPFWNDLGSAEPNLSSDDPTSSATPEQIAAAADIATKHYRNFGVSAADLTASVAGDDPMRRMAERIAGSWVRRIQKQLIASLTGVYLENIATNSSDMINDISGNAGAEKITAEAILDAAQTMGDEQEGLSMIITHSAVANVLKKDNLIDYIPDARGEVNIPTYLGYELIVDDGMPVTTGTYTTYLVGMGAIAWGESMPRVPIEVQREAAQADGGGVEQLWTRREYVLHPRGHASQAAAIAAGGDGGQSPTNTVLATAASWTRVFERKRCKLAFLVHDLANTP